MFTVTQAWAAAGSNGGFGVPGVVGLRARDSQPKLNGTGKATPLIGVRCASAGDGMICCCFGCGENGKGGRGRARGGVFNSPHTPYLGPPLTVPPRAYRPAKVVASGSRKSLIGATQVGVAGPAQEPQAGVPTVRKHCQLSYRP